MKKPTTIIFPDYITDYMRDALQAFAHGSVVENIQNDPDPKHRPEALKVLQSFRIAPVYDDPVSVSDKVRIFHVEFAPFSVNDANPQISCHMVGHVHWNATITKEMVSIKFRFNLWSHEQTNAYITYL